MLALGRRRLAGLAYHRVGLPGYQANKDDWPAGLVCSTANAGYFREFVSKRFFFFTRKCLDSCTHAPPPPVVPPPSTLMHCRPLLLLPVLRTPRRRTTFPRRAMLPVLRPPCFLPTPRAPAAAAREDAHLAGEEPCSTLPFKYFQHFMLQNSTFHLYSFDILNSNAEFV